MIGKGYPKRPRDRLLTLNQQQAVIELQSTAMALERNLTLTGNPDMRLCSSVHQSVEALYEACRSEYHHGVQVLEELATTS